MSWIVHAELVAADARRQLGQEVRDEERDVFAAVAKRRQDDRGNDVQPVVEILAETPGGDLLLEILVGRREDAHVDLERLFAADPLELFFLQGAQELQLHSRRDVADLVEKQGPAGGQLEAAELALDRTGERPLLVPEELTPRGGTRRAPRS